MTKCFPRDPRAAIQAEGQRRRNELKQQERYFWGPDFYFEEFSLVNVPTDIATAIMQAEMQEHQERTKNVNVGTYATF